jgi:hypothetical protein
LDCRPHHISALGADSISAETMDSPHDPQLSHGTHELDMGRVAHRSAVACACDNNSGYRCSVPPSDSPAQGPSRPRARDGCCRPRNTCAHNLQRSTLPPISHSTDIAFTCVAGRTRPVSGSRPRGHRRIRRPGVSQHHRHIDYADNCFSWHRHGSRGPGRKRSPTCSLAST